MANPNSEPGKRNISQELWETVETLSDDAQQATLRKAKDLNFDINKGAIPFDETLLNLAHNRDVLREAIRQARIPQLPLKIQETLLTDAKKVSTHLIAIANGSDAILPLENAVEDLTASVWYSGLQNLSGEILGLQTKLNQLKALETTLRAAQRRAEEFEQKETKATEILSQLGSLSESALKASTQISEAVASTETIGSRLKEVEQQAGASFAAIQQNSKSATDGAAAIGVHSSETEAFAKRTKELLTEVEALRDAFRLLEEQLKSLGTATETTLKESQASHDSRLTGIAEGAKTEIEALRKSSTEAVDALVKDSSAKVAASLAQIQEDASAVAATLQKAEEDRKVRWNSQLAASKEEFVTESKAVRETYRASFEELESKAMQTINKNEAELERLTKHLTELEDIIREKIELATNYQLFHSFQTRQYAIEKSKNFWAWALAGCVALSVIVSSIFIWYLPYVKVYNAAFYMKLSISLPIIYAITFCSLQFSRERRLEEEYAFKANISISLDPYRKLVADLVDEDNPAAKAKYADFVIEAINKVFTSPTSHSFDEKSSGGEIITGILKEVGKIIEPLVKAVGK